MQSSPRPSEAGSDFFDDAEAQVAAALEGSDAALICTALDGRITGWSRGAERIFGHTREKIVGQSMTTLVPMEYAAEHASNFARVSAGHRLPPFETTRVGRDGERVLVSLALSAMRNRNGAVVGVLVVVREFADQTGAAESALQRHAHKLEAMVAERTAHLKQTIAELEGVSYSLSHDLRGPLRTIQGFAQLVLDDAGERLNAEERDLLTKAVKAAHRLDRLIQDVLTYSRVSRQAIAVEPIDVERLLRQIIDERPELRSPRAELEIVSPLLPVRGHEASLTQVITNLLDNAVKFVPPERTPRVRIFSRPAGEQVELWFEDNGIGIPKEAQPRLFAIFQRVHDDKRYPGTGIGLAIVRKAVERMGGTVELQSELGAGSRFCVRLPKASS